MSVYVTSLEIITSEAAPTAVLSAAAAEELGTLATSPRHLGKDRASRVPHVGPCLEDVSGEALSLVCSCSPSTGSRREVVFKQEVKLTFCLLNSQNRCPQNTERPSGLAWATDVHAEGVLWFTKLV